MIGVMVVVLNIRETALSCVVDDYQWPWQACRTVVMQHGFCRNASFWNPWVRSLVHDSRVYRPEVRGCGKSAAPDPSLPLTAELIADDVIAILDELGIESCHWVGEHSGTLIGMAIAVKAPERVSSLVLCDLPALNPSTKPNALGEGSSPDALLKYGPGEWSRRTLSHRLDLDKASAELRDWYVAEMGKVASDVAARLNVAFHVVREAGTIPFEKVTAPVLLISGDRRAPDALRANEDMVNRLPNARLAWLEGYGAGINVVAADRCLELARDFWDSN